MLGRGTATIDKSCRAARTWTDFSHVRWLGREKVKSRIGKVKFAELLRKSGLPHASILARFKCAEEIDLRSLPPSFVLKPSALWSAKGVMLLHRVADTTLLYEAMKRYVMSDEEVRASQMQLQSEAGKKLSFIAEERVLDESDRFIIPLDYKIFTFFGVTKFVLQVDRNHTPPKICFFDGKFEPITDQRVYIPAEKQGKTQGIHRKPSCYRELLEMARSLTRELEAPFISVDCYAGRQGPVFGELTHTPGGPWFGLMYRFSDAFDEELGQAWISASEALGLEVPLVETPYDIRFKGRIVRTVER